MLFLFSFPISIQTHPRLSERDLAWRWHSDAKKMISDQSSHTIFFLYSSLSTQANVAEQAQGDGRFFFSFLFLDKRAAQHKTHIIGHGNGVDWRKKQMRIVQST